MTAARQGLFLDFDGTLVDSVPVLYRIYLEFLREQGCCGSVAEFERLNGPSLPEIVAILKQQYGMTAPREVLLERYDNLIARAYQPLSAMPGTRAVISAARARQWKVAIVTSNSGPVAQDWLRGQGLTVDAVVGRKDAMRCKPHPDLYLEALRRTGCAASDSVAVEDSVQGARAAAGAGIRTYLVGRNTTAECASVESLVLLAKWIADGRFPL